MTTDYTDRAENRILASDFTFQGQVNQSGSGQVGPAFLFMRIGVKIECMQTKIIVSSWKLMQLLLPRLNGVV